MFHAHTGFAWADHNTSAPGTIYVNLLDFSPVEGESWRSPKVLRSKIYVNTTDGWETEGFYQVEKLGPRDWLVHHVTPAGEFDRKIILAKTRTIAFNAAAADLRHLAQKQSKPGGRMNLREAVHAVRVGGTIHEIRAGETASFHVQSINDDGHAAVLVRLDSSPSITAGTVENPGVSFTAFYEGNRAPSFTV